MKPEILKKAIQLQKEIDELEEIRDCGIKLLVKHILSGKYAEYRSSWFSGAYEIPWFLQRRIREVIVDEIEARKIMLADLGEE